MAMRGVMDAGGQLAVGEGARASLAELDVGGGIEGTGAPKALHIPVRSSTGRPRSSTTGGDSVPDQVERGEEAPPGPFPPPPAAAWSPAAPGERRRAGAQPGSRCRSWRGAPGRAHRPPSRSPYRHSARRSSSARRWTAAPGRASGWRQGDPENPRGAFFQLFHPAADREGDILNPYHFDHLGNSVPRLSGMHNGNCGEQGGSRGN